MVNDREEKHEYEEEIEYQFTDEEQAEYEGQPEVTKAAEPAKSDIKEKIIAGLKRYRRMLIGVVVFFIVIFIVYKMLQPTSTLPPTEFSQTIPQKPPVAVGTPKPLVPEVTKPAPTPAPTPTPAPAPASAQTQVQPPQPQPVATPPQPQTSPLAEVQPSPQPIPPTAQTQPALPSTPLPAPVQTPQTQAAIPAPITAPTPPPPPATMPIVSSTNTAPTPPPAILPSPPPEMAPPPVVAGEASNKVIMEKLAALDEQNAKMMTLIQTQFAQKIAEYEAESRATKERLDMVNKRISNMEAGLGRVAQVTQERGYPVAVPSTPPPPRSSQPRLTYVVQAIIPGRAWLKSDAGDTVTVAEGDYLKDYGRISKIDPYDGIVEIDIGNKIITLSYGSGSE